MSQNMIGAVALMALVFSVAALSLTLSDALRDSPPGEDVGLREDVNAALRDIAVMRGQLQQVEKDVTGIQLTLSQAEVCLTLIGAIGLAAYEDAFELASRDHWQEAGCDDYIASVAE